MLSITILFLAFLVIVVSEETPRLDGRIIGGSAANILDYPYQLSLQKDEVHVCGASIIHYTIALTAAHCVYKIPKEHFSVNAGSSWHFIPQVVEKITAITVHENYDDDAVDYDIALLQWRNKLPFGKTILPIALPKANENILIGTLAVATGWGYRSEDGFVSSILQKVSLPIIGRRKCSRLYNAEAEITPRMLCAGYVSGGKDACQGDSGGPLVANGKLVGIVSWGYGCGRKGFPGVYTKVSKFRTWIKRNVNV